MEALVVAITALIALVLIDAGHWIAVSLVRWTPIIVVGAIAGWLAGRQGLEPFEALGMGILASTLARYATYLLERHALDGGAY